MGEKLYYVFKIIKEAREPISAKDILKRLENYEIFLDIKTVYSLNTNFIFNFRLSA